MFLSRINEIKSHLKKQKLDAVLISSVSNITYLTGYANFSKDEREAYLLIGNDFQYIITDGRYSEAIKREVPHFELFERSHKTPTEKLFKDLKKKIDVLGVEEDELTVAEHKLLRKYFEKTKHFNINAHRSIKTADEIKKIEKAAKLGDKTFEFILGKIKPGISEIELAYELELFIKQNGADLSFPSIIAFGKNSSVPHHQTGNTKLTGKDKFILLDFGVKYENYCSDMTRTIFFGKPTGEQKRIYKIVLEAQQKAVDFINSTVRSGGVLRVSEVDKLARDYIVSKKYPTIPHSLGHGIGLEVHECPSLSPKSKEILKEGMVFSIEPGIYLPAGRQGLPNFGSPRAGGDARRVEAGGVRIEDLYVLRETSLQQLTHSPKSIISL